MNALTVRGLTKTYKNGVTALKGINLDVAEGDFFALLGPNGAGKSTTIGIISSLVNKTSGNVMIFNHDMEVETAFAKSLIGIVPQEVNFGLFEKISHTLINQAGFYGIPESIARKRMEKYLRQMGLWEKREQAAVALSGGMKRRLMIARAMMNEPKLLILDEPTAGVDIELRHTLWHFLTEINKAGTTIILTTHYLEEAEQLCKNVAIIDHGEIIIKENMKNLINRLQSQTFVLDLEKPVNDPIHLMRFATQLIDAHTLEVELAKGQTLNELFSALNEIQVNIVGLRNKTNRLEKLFMNIVKGNAGYDHPL